MENRNIQRMDKHSTKMINVTNERGALKTRPPTVIYPTKKRPPALYIKQEPEAVHQGIRWDRTFLDIEESKVVPIVDPPPLKKRRPALKDSSMNFDFQEDDDDELSEIFENVNDGKKKRAKPRKKPTPVFSNVREGALLVFIYQFPSMIKKTGSVGYSNNDGCFRWQR